MRKILNFMKYLVVLVVPTEIWRSLVRQYTLIKAKLSSRGFYCNVLQGNSDYNFCINSDLTVSCNCQDYDGSGHLGDLRSQSLMEILCGEKAQHFRGVLSSRKFPLPLCAFCNELRTEKKSLLRSKEVTMRTKGIMVENTVLCNLDCTYCDRSIVMNTRKVRQMSLPDMERVAIRVHESGIKHVHFYNLGEPFMSSRIKEELELLKAHNHELTISTATNGVLIDSDEKRMAAMYFSKMFISLDGVNQEQVTRYQVGGNFDAAYSNIKKLVEFRDSRGLKTPVIVWKYVLFKWNDSTESTEKALFLAKQAGVDVLHFHVGGAPIQHRSQRYWTDPKFRRLGGDTGQGILIHLSGA